MDGAALRLEPRRAATKEGLADAEAAFPFPLTAMHSDSGLEFLNAHVLGYARDRPRPSPSPVPAPGTRTTTPAWSRRTPVVREYFGYERIDRL